MVTWPTRTPPTSVIALSGPGVSAPGAIPRSRARGRLPDVCKDADTANTTPSATHRIRAPYQKDGLCRVFRPGTRRTSVGAERGQRRDARRAARREPGRGERGEPEDHRGGQEHHRIERLDVVEQAAQRE